ncbi:MAG: hypothetical protein ACXW00_03115 [Methylobacter sp.]
MIHLIDSDAISVNCHARHITRERERCPNRLAPESVVRGRTSYLRQAPAWRLHIEEALGAMSISAYLIDTVVAVRIKDEDGHCNVDRDASMHPTGMHYLALISSLSPLEK